MNINSHAVDLEIASKAVFDVMDQDGPIGSERPQWVTCAKTPKQETARRYASAALSAISAPTPPPQADGKGCEGDLLIAKNALLNEARRVGPLTTHEINEVFARRNRTIFAAAATEAEHG